MVRSAARRYAHPDTVGARLRSGFKLLSPLNFKTPLGESYGYLTAILYLAPHTLAGGKTVCPHSTDSCREGCLYYAGRGNAPRAQMARIRRTQLFLSEPQTFLSDIAGELAIMQQTADQNGLKLAVRLNGTSDIRWEHELIADSGESLFDLFPRATFYDFTRTPSRHRHVPDNWQLTFSLADAPLSYAVDHLLAGRNVAAVVPYEEKFVGQFMLGNLRVNVIDGDLHDLRFLDPRPSLVLLKPKGRLRRRGPMVRPGLVPALIKEVESR